MISNAPLRGAETLISTTKSVEWRRNSSWISRAFLLNTDQDLLCYITANYHRNLSCKRTRIMALTNVPLRPAMSHELSSYYHCLHYHFHFRLQNPVNNDFVLSILKNLKPETELTRFLARAHRVAAPFLPAATNLSCVLASPSSDSPAEFFCKNLMTIKDNLSYENF